MVILYSLIQLKSDCSHIDNTLDAIFTDILWP